MRNLLESWTKWMGRWVGIMWLLGWLVVVVAHCSIRLVESALALHTWLLKHHPSTPVAQAAETVFAIKTSNTSSMLLPLSLSLFGCSLQNRLAHACSTSILEITTQRCRSLQQGTHQFKEVGLRRHVAKASEQPGRVRDIASSFPLKEWIASDSSDIA